MSEVRLADCTGWTTVLVRAGRDGALAAALGVPHGRAARDGQGTLIVGTAPGAWLLLAPATPADRIVPGVEAVARGEFASVVDVTHGHVLLRLTGAEAPSVLAALCAADLSARTAPDGTALRTLIAGIPATLVRDDEDGVLSYLLACDRSYGRYLADVISDALRCTCQA